MRPYPRHRSSPANAAMRADVHAAVKRCLDALEFGLDVADARNRMLDALSVYACEVEMRRAVNQKKRRLA